MFKILEGEGFAKKDVIETCKNLDIPYEDLSSDDPESREYDSFRSYYENSDSLKIEYCDAERGRYWIAGGNAALKMFAWEVRE